MYAFLKQLLLIVLRVPAEPPHIPADGHTRVDVFRASPRFLAYQYFLLAFGLLGTLTLAGVAITALVVVGQPWSMLLAAGVALFWLAKAFILYASTRLSYELRYYIVTDKSLRIRQGILVVRELTLTYANVQNVSIQQGPFERLFGISTVLVETAGGGSPRPGASGGHEGALQGIANAEEVRDLIRSRLGDAHRHAGLGDPEEGSASQRSLGTGELPVLQEILEEARALRRAAGPGGAPSR